jgi:hypothetical protein
MSLAVEQDTDDIVLAETESVLESNGMLDDAAKDVAGAGRSADVHRRDGPKS